MNAKQKSEALRMAEDNLTAVLCDPEGKCCISGSDADRRIIDDALGILRTLTEQAQPAQEPVAWMNVKYGTFFGAGVIAATDRNDDLIASGELVRLYLHPAPAQTPLTDEQIMALWHDGRPAAIAFARAIERAHSIGEKT